MLRSNRKIQIGGLLEVHQFCAKFTFMVQSVSRNYALNMAVEKIEAVNVTVLEKQVEAESASLQQLESAGLVQISKAKEN
jgi:hypothetical protein